MGQPRAPLLLALLAVGRAAAAPPPAGCSPPPTTAACWDPAGAVVNTSAQRGADMCCAACSASFDCAAWQMRWDKTAQKTLCDTLTRAVPGGTGDCRAGVRAPDPSPGPAPPTPPGPTPPPPPGPVPPTPPPTPPVPPPPPAGPRPFPDTTDGLHVFPDYVGDDRQCTPTSSCYGRLRFIATHYAGTQKVMRQAADMYRSVNPGFAVLHYRLSEELGYRVATDQTSCVPDGKYVHIVDGNEWVQEWPGDSAVKEEWFYKYNGSSRFYFCRWGSYVMDITNRGWQEYWVAQVLKGLADNDNDGVFADSFGVPSYMGMNPRPAFPLPERDENGTWHNPTEWEEGWFGAVERHVDFVVSQLRPKGYAYVPNVGGLDVSRDRTNYSGVDGVMIEGCGFDAADQGGWQLQTDRVIALANAGKIVLCQSYHYTGQGDWAQQARLFTTAGYLLWKGARSYLSYGAGVEWYPEFDIPIGRPAETHATLDGYRREDWGVYAREYSGGLVLVNTNAEAVDITLPSPMYNLRTWGGGGQWGNTTGFDAASGLSCSELSPPTCGLNATRLSSVSLSGKSGGGIGSAAILLKKAPGPGPRKPRR